MIIPSFYSVKDVGYAKPDNTVFGNTLLRVGEVKGVIYPDSDKSISGKYIEYDVVVQHREGNVAVSKLYHNCYLADSLGGRGDSSFRTLRVPDEKKTDPSNEQGIENLGTGSKVLILCINGGHNEAVIISGIRDGGDDKKRKQKGIHLEWEFNGVRLEIADDGSFSVEKKGPTKSSGERDKTKGADEEQNTKISVDKDGSFAVRTKDNKQSVVIDHKAGTITIEGDKELTLQGKNINIGSGADEAAVLGDTLVKIMGELIDEITKLKVPTAWGPSGVPINTPKFMRIKSKLRNMLSKFIRVKKTSK